MLKNIQNLGTSLTRKEQKQVNGGFGTPCNTNADCWNIYPGIGRGDVSCRYSSFGWGGKVCVLN